MSIIEFGGFFYRSERVATAAFLEWYLNTRVDATETADGVFKTLQRDIADREVKRYDWLTDDLIRSELPAALKQAQFNDDRAAENLAE